MLGETAGPVCEPEGGLIDYPNKAMVQRAINPTLRENIQRQIQGHKDEIARLEELATKVPSLLDVNIRDLQMAMRC